MFFKIFLSVVTTFLIVAYLNIGTTNPLPLLKSESLSFPKNETSEESAQIISQQEKFLPAKDECKSYINTPSGKICLPQDTHSCNRGAGASVVADKKLGTEDMLNFQNSLNGPARNISVPVQDIGVTDGPKIEEPKFEPGLIFIPFSTKNCGWFCK